MGFAKDQNSAGLIEIVPIVSGRTFQPLVQLKWGDREGQLTINEARQHALAVLEVAEAAESDAFVFNWLTRDIIGTEEDQRGNWNHVIEEFKAFRKAREKKDNGLD